MGVVQEETICGETVTTVTRDNKYAYERVSGFSIGFGPESAGTSGAPAVREPEAGQGAENGAPERPVDGKGGAASPPQDGPTTTARSFIPLAESDEPDGGDSVEEAEDRDEMEEELRRDVPASEFSLPWESTCRRIYSPLLRLHQEIVEFAKFLQPTAQERRKRQDAIARVKEVIVSLWPSARVEVFGSYETGLYLPTSDIDMVVLNSNCTNVTAGLRLLANKASAAGIAKNLLVLSKAKIPIVKFEDAETNFKFDISFDVDGGPQAVIFIKDMIRAQPLIRPLVYILKIFLQQRELNEVYSGGIGSYGLIIMVNVFLLTHESRLDKRDRRWSDQKAEKCLGILLIDFFELYGHTLNMYEVGISSRKGGFFYDKRSYGFYSVDRPYLLSIEDPLQRDSDIGKNSFNIQKVKQAFQFAHQVLTAPESEFGELLLMRIVRMDGVLVRRLEAVGPAAGEEGEEPGVARAEARVDLPPRPMVGGSPTEEGGPRTLSQREKMAVMGVAISISSEEEEGEVSGSEDGEVQVVNVKRSRLR